MNTLDVKVGDYGINLRPASKGTETCAVPFLMTASSSASIYDPHRRVLKLKWETRFEMLELSINLRPASKGTETAKQKREKILKAKASIYDPHRRVLKLAMKVNNIAAVCASIYDPHRRVLKRQLSFKIVYLWALHQSTTRIEGY